MINEYDIFQILEMLLKTPRENEVLEFKEAKVQYDFSKFCKYFSALSNEANLHNKAFAWFILGVKDEPINGMRQVVGTNWRIGSHNKLKQEISEKLSGGITFRNIYEIFYEEKRVLMFEIPACENGIPVAFDGQYYGRNDESLCPLSIDKIEAIRRKNADWSREIVPNATLNDLDPTAIKKAREQYKIKNSSKEDTVEFMAKLTDEAFLERIRLTIKGKITNSALLLLGKPESVSLITIGQPRITWVLVGSDNEKKDYEHFYPPFITVVDRIKKRIRNLKYRYMVGQQSLFPQEVWQYDDWVLREIINNCIAHQDYRLGGNTRITEYEDKIEFINSGFFIPESIEAVVLNNFIPPTNRNQCLVSAMCEINMIDSITSGIQRIYRIQRNKGFPLPTYNFANGRVTVTIDGKILNENYTRLLFNEVNMDLDTVFMLDKIQKKLPLSKESVASLRKKGFIEGRYPNIFIAEKIAEKVDEKQEYIKNKAFDDDYYKKLILQYLSKYHCASFADIFKLLESKLSDVLNNDQKKRKAKYLLAQLKKSEKITLNGNTKAAVWCIKQ